MPDDGPVRVRSAQARLLSGETAMASAHHALVDAQVGRGGLAGSSPLRPLKITQWAKHSRGSRLWHVTFQPLLSLASCFAPGQAQHASAVILLLGESIPIAADGGNLEEDARTDDS